MTRAGRRRIERFLPWLIVLGTIALWEICCVAFRIPVFILPGPHQVIAALVTDWQPVLGHSAQTLFTTLVGFILAVIVGMFLGIAIGGYSLIYAGFYPLLIGFNSVPKVALLPILVLWFGIGTVPAIISSFAFAFFPILVNVATGISTMEPEMKDVLRSLGAKHRQILTKIGIPRSLPYLFASLKVAVTLSFVGSIVAESIASNRGIGYLMITASSRFDVPLVFAGLVVSAIMGVGMYAVCALWEARMTRWALRGKAT